MNSNIIPAFTNIGENKTSHINFQKNLTDKNHHPFRFLIRLVLYVATLVIF